MTKTQTAKPKAPAIPAWKAYAKSIGGTSHKGQMLYLIIGDSFDTAAQATTARKRAHSAFGNRRTYFIVQRSDNFLGIRPGLWLVMEAYRSADNARNRLELAQRAFSYAHISRAVVKTADPIPVYEDVAK